MAEVAVIGNYDIRDKKLADASTNTSVASTDAVMLKDTNGNYVEIDRDSFTDAVRSALGPILTNMTQKTAASGGVMVNDSNDVGTMNLSNLASLLGVIWKSFKVNAASSYNTNIYGYSGDSGKFNCFVFAQGIISASQTSYQFGLITYNHSSGHPQYRSIANGNNGDTAYNLSFEFTVGSGGNIYIHNHSIGQIKVTMVVIPH